MGGTKNRTAQNRVEDVVVSSWSELNEALYAGSWKEPLQRHRLSCAFRGQSDRTQPLTTSLSRMGLESWRVEGAMLRAFRKYARFQTTRGYDTIWDWLAVAQHHGLPTRLLDWTYSPLIALHFATAEAPESDGVVWGVDFARTNTLLPGRLRQLLQSEGADVFTADLLAEAASTLPAFDQLSEREFLLFLEPPSIDARIINQFALFSLMSDPRAQLNDWLDRRGRGIRRIIIPSGLKPEVRDMLDQSNVNERVLFPGLDGLTAYLRRYYTPAQRHGGRAVPGRAAQARLAIAAKDEPGADAHGTGPDRRRRMAEGGPKGRGRMKSADTALPRRAANAAAQDEGNRRARKLKPRPPRQAAREARAELGAPSRGPKADAEVAPGRRK